MGIVNAGTEPPSALVRSVCALAHGVSEQEACVLTQRESYIMGAKTVEVGNTGNISDTRLRA